MAIVLFKVATTLSIIMEEITITTRTVVEMAIRTHDLVLRMTIHHLSSVILTIVQLGCVIIVLIICTPR